MNEGSIRLSNDKDVWFWSESITVKVNDEVQVPDDCKAIVVYNGRVMDVLKPGNKILNSGDFPIFSTVSGLYEASYNLIIIYLRNKPLELKWGIPTFHVGDKDDKLLTLSALGKAEIVVNNYQKFFENNYPALDMGVEQQDAHKKFLRSIIVEGAREHIIEEVKKASLKDKIKISSSNLGAEVKEKRESKWEESGFNINNICLEELTLVKQN